MSQLGFDVELVEGPELDFTYTKQENQFENDPFMQLFEGDGGQSSSGNYQEEQNQEPAKDFGGSPVDQPPEHNLVKSMRKEEKYTFIDEYPEWQWADDYTPLGYQTVNIDDITPHPDFTINDEDFGNGSSRVRPKTLIYYLTETTEMKPLVVDQNMNLLDGYHRYYVLDKTDQNQVRIVVVESKTTVEQIKGSEVPEYWNALTRDEQIRRKQRAKPNSKIQRYPVKGKDKVGKPKEKKRSFEKKSNKREEKTGEDTKDNKEKKQKNEVSDPNSIWKKFKNPNNIKNATPDKLHEMARTMFLKGISTYDKDIQGNQHPVFTTRVKHDTPYYHGTHFELETLKKMFRENGTIGREDLFISTKFETAQKYPIGKTINKKFTRTIVDGIAISNIDAGEVIFEFDGKLVSDKYSITIDPHIY
ncbi:MAG: hypothetical protein OEY49_19330, partial [Candidatus Heimdallarchaeota archaeon]|nr:hypothetical protein [Candidatus Heimdallarchaeota archaeon]